MPLGEEFLPSRNVHLPVLVVFSDEILALTELTDDSLDHGDSTSGLQQGILHLQTYRWNERHVTIRSRSRIFTVATRLSQLLHIYPRSTGLLSTNAVHVLEVTLIIICCTFIPLSHSKILHINPRSTSLTYLGSIVLLDNAHSSKINLTHR